MQNKIPHTPGEAVNAVRGSVGSLISSPQVTDGVRFFYGRENSTFIAQKNFMIFPPSLGKSLHSFQLALSFACSL